MIQFDGRYRGIVIDHAVDATGNGYPQLVATLQANEVYDNDNGWQAFSDGMNNQIMMYAVLANESGELFWAEAIRSTLGWATNSFSDLQNMDLAGHPIQFTLQYEDYNGKSSPKIKSIAEYDSETCGGSGPLRKADSNKLADLDNRFGKFMKAPAGGMKKPVKPKGAPKLPPSQTSLQERPKHEFTTIDDVWAAVINEPGIKEDEATSAWQDVVPQVMTSSGKDEAAFGKVELDEVYNKVMDKIMPF
jgi:hypothetical protein